MNIIIKTLTKDVEIVQEKKLKAAKDTEEGN